MRISIYRPAKLKPHGSVCPPFWIVTVEWSGARSCLFWWRHRFQIASFSSSTLENSVFKKHRCQIAPLWRAFSNGSVFGDRFRRCTVDDSRIRSKTVPFSFDFSSLIRRFSVNWFSSAIEPRRVVRPLWVSDTQFKPLPRNHQGRVVRSLIKITQG